MFLTKLLLSLSATLLSLALWKLSGLLFQMYRSPLRSIPGPRSSHFFYGNMKEIIKAVRGHSILSPKINCINPTQDNSAELEKWIAEL
jgi:hypothetical protein